MIEKVTIHKEVRGWTKGGGEMRVPPGTYKVIDHLYGFPDRRGEAWFDIILEDSIKVNYFVVSVDQKDTDQHLHDPDYSDVEQDTTMAVEHLVDDHGYKGEDAVALANYENGPQNEHRHLHRKEAEPPVR